MTRDLIRWLFAGLFALWAQVCCCQSAAVAQGALDRLPGADTAAVSVDCCAGTVESTGCTESEPPGPPCQRCPERRGAPGIAPAPHHDAAAPPVQTGVVQWSEASAERPAARPAGAGRPARSSATGPPRTLRALRCALVI